MSADFRWIQEQQCRQIAVCHAGIRNIRKRPHDLQLHHRPDAGGKAENPLKQADIFSIRQIRIRRCPAVAPPDQCTQAEQCRHWRQKEIRRIPHTAAECLQHQHTAVRTGIHHARAENRKRSCRTAEKCIRKDLAHTGNAQNFGASVRLAMQDAAAAESGFIREDPPAQSDGYRTHDRRTADAAGNFPQAECTLKNIPHHRRNPVPMQEDHQPCPDQIEDGQHGNDDLREFPDTPCIPRKHQPCDHCRTDSGQQGRHIHCGGECLRHGIRLCHIAHAKACENAADGECGGKLRALQTMAEVGDRTAFPRTAIPAGEEIFRIDQSHSRDSGDPHPEHRPCAAKRKGGRNAGDIPRAHGSGEGGGTCLKDGHAVFFACFLRLLQEYTETAECGESARNHADNPRAEEQDEQTISPEELVDL